MVEEDLGVNDRLPIWREIYVCSQMPDAHVEDPTTLRHHLHIGSINSKPLTARQLLFVHANFNLTYGETHRLITRNCRPDDGDKKTDALIKLYDNTPEPHDADLIAFKETCKINTDTYIIGVDDDARTIIDGYNIAFRSFNYRFVVSDNHYSAVMKMASYVPFVVARGNVALYDHAIVLCEDDYQANRSMRFSAIFHVFRSMARRDDWLNFMAPVHCNRQVAISFCARPSVCCCALDTTGGSTHIPRFSAIHYAFGTVQEITAFVSNIYYYNHRNSWDWWSGIIERPALDLLVRRGEMQYINAVVMAVVHDSYKREISDRILHAILRTTRGDPVGGTALLVEFLPHIQRASFVSAQTVACLITQSIDVIHIVAKHVSVIDNDTTSPKGAFGGCNVVANLLGRSPIDIRTPGILRIFGVSDLSVTACTKRLLNSTPDREEELDRVFGFMSDTL